MLFDGNLEVGQYSLSLRPSRISYGSGEDVLCFVESGKEKPDSEQSAFVAAMVNLEKS